jgi:hypothetical protein
MIRLMTAVSSDSIRTVVVVSLFKGWNFSFWGKGDSISPYLPISDFCIYPHSGIPQRLKGLILAKNPGSTFYRRAASRPFHSQVQARAFPRENRGWAEPGHHQSLKKEYLTPLQPFLKRCSAIQGGQVLR